MTQQTASYFVRGDTWRVRVRLKQSDGELLSLAGCTFHSEVRETADSLETARTIAVTGPDSNGWLTLSLTPAQTVDLSYGVYDLRVTFPSGDVTTYFPARPLRVRKSASHA